MNKIIKKIFLLILIGLSFYFTEKTAIFIRNQDPIMQGIMDYASNNNIEPVNATINNDYITPGLIGKRINEVKSLMQMKAIGIFNKTFLVTTNIKPEISLEDNKDKIINKANNKKNAVSFIIENDNTNSLTYFISSKIPASILINNKTFNKNPYFEQINNDFDNYNEVDKKLNKNKINTNICLINRTNKELCIKKKKYLVEPTHILNSSNIVMIKNKITSGDIILIKSNVTIDDISLLYNYLKSKNIKVRKLSELISEK